MTRYEIIKKFVLLVLSVNILFVCSGCLGALLFVPIEVTGGIAETVLGSPKNFKNKEDKRRVAEERKVTREKDRRAKNEEQKLAREKLIREREKRKIINAQKKELALKKKAEIEKKQKEEKRINHYLNFGCYEEVKKYNAKSKEEKILCSHILEIYGLLSRVEDRIITINKTKGRLRQKALEHKKQVRLISFEKKYQRCGEALKDPVLSDWLALIYVSEERIKNMEDYKKILESGVEDLVFVGRRACNSFAYIQLAGEASVRELIVQNKSVLANNQNIAERKEKAIKSNKNDLIKIWEEAVK